MSSVIQIINGAFILLGKPPVNDAESQSSNPAFAAAVDTYDTLLPWVLGRAAWRFAMKSFELNFLVDPPPLERWPKQAQLPFDLIRILRTEPIINYEIFGDKMFLNNVEGVKLEYTFQPSEALFPPFFTQLMIYQVAANIAMSVTQNPQIATLWETRAQQALLLAKQLNSTSQPNVPVIRDAALSAHFGSPRPALVQGNV